VIPTIVGEGSMDILSLLFGVCLVVCSSLVIWLFETSPIINDDYKEEEE
jgi:hypothetical protein